jgi:DNA-binding transcriptional LysR family regulator
MDRLDAMNTVLAVAEAGSLSEAARRQKTPLATVSRKVSELEAHLQTRLFQRTSRTLIPTEAGRSYIAAAKRILADIAEAERAASGEYSAPKGELTVSAPIGLGRLHLLPVVTEFLKAFPEVTVQLGLQDRAVNLAEDHVDVALRIGLLADSSLIAARIGEMHRVACASPSYLKARGRPKSPEDLATHDCISYAPVMSPSAWGFRRDGVEQVVPVHSRLIVGSYESAVDAACAGIGVTLAFSYHVDGLVKAGKLETFLDDHRPPPVPISFVYPSNRFMPVKLRAFLDFALPRLKARLALR